MSTERPIKATLTRCRHGQPLIQLESQPFNGLEITPGELRTMAMHLTALADLSCKTPTGGKHWKPTTVVIGGNANASEQPTEKTPKTELSDEQVGLIFRSFFEPPLSKRRKV